jgi:hypothetical protein
MIIAGTRQVSRILGLQARAIPKAPKAESITITAKRNYRGGPCRIEFPARDDFPDDLGLLYDRFFGEAERAKNEYSQRYLPKDVPVVRLRIVWQESAITNPDGVVQAKEQLAKAAPDTEAGMDLSPDTQPNRLDSTLEVTSALRVLSEIESAKDLS